MIIAMIVSFIFGHIFGVHMTLNRLADAYGDKLIMEMLEGMRKENNEKEDKNGREDP